MFSKSPKGHEQEKASRETLYIGMDTISHVMNIEHRGDLSPGEKVACELEIAERFKEMGRIVAPCGTRPSLRFRKDAEAMRKLQDLIEVDGAGSIFRLIRLTHAWLHYRTKNGWKGARTISGDKPEVLETVSQALQGSDLMVEGLEAKSDREVLTSS